VAYWGFFAQNKWTDEWKWTKNKYYFKTPEFDYWRVSQWILKFEKHAYPGDWGNFGAGINSDSSLGWRNATRGDSKFEGGVLDIDKQNQATYKQGGAPGTNTEYRSAVEQISWKVQSTEDKCRLNY